MWLVAITSEGADAALFAEILEISPTLLFLSLFLLIILLLCFAFLLIRSYSKLNFIFSLTSKTYYWGYKVLVDINSKTDIELLIIIEYYFKVYFNSNFYF